MIVASTPQTLRIGLLAGLIGTVVGTFLGLVAGFFGGWLDRIIRPRTDVVLTIPPLAILLIVAASVRSISVELMAIIIAALAWMHPARTIRAQVLSLRERAYVEIARVSGMQRAAHRAVRGAAEPAALIMSSFVTAVSSAILATIGLEALGFGPQDTPTLGMTIYWSLLYGAFGRNMWWWWVPPIVILAILFIGLFLHQRRPRRGGQPAPQEAVMSEPLLEVRDLTVAYRSTASAAAPPTASASTCMPASGWASSASPVRASRRWRWR